jgi:hypothetical protein
MQPEWFSGRRCLDMGCNEGLLTLGLATKFGCDSMLGLDIDAALVHKAARHLRESRAEATAKLQQPGLPDRQGQLQALRARVKALSKVGCEGHPGAGWRGVVRLWGAAMPAAAAVCPSCMHACMPACSF